MHKRKNPTIYAHIIIYTFTFVQCEELTKLSCNVNYRGRIQFSFDFPRDYDKEYDANFCYYKFTDSQSLHGHKCLRMRNLNNCICRHKIFPLQLHPYQFYVSIFSSNGSVDNITRFVYSSGNTTKEVLPWIPYESIPKCKNSIGTKHMSFVASKNSLEINWITYPLTMLYRDIEIQVKLTGPKIKKTNQINISDCCEKDLCSYTFMKMRSCSDYSVCVLTHYPVNKTNVKCGSIRTYCHIKPNISWTKTTLIEYGVIIFIMSAAILIFLRWRSLHQGKIYFHDQQISPRITYEEEYTIVTNTTDTHDYVCINKYE